MVKRSLAFALVLFGASLLSASGLPVSPAHPRILLAPAIVSSLKAKVAANDSSWVALKAAADRFASYSIFPYISAMRSEEPDNTIFYDYEGSGWFEAAVPLALAYQMTGDTKYSNPLLALADEMVAAQSRPQNQPPAGELPLEVDDYYPTRYLGPTLGIIYDWCYDQLGSSRKAQMIALMNTYFTEMAAHAYQNDSNADGNYFGGHLICAAYMGYSSFGDNPQAQEMIDYARMRFDGTPSALVATGNVPSNYFSQCFDGGIQSAVAAGYNGLPDILSAPFAGGFDFQGWAYGSGEYERIIDYMLTVRSATGEDVITSNLSWFSQILMAEKSALFPDGFQIDPSGDWGGYYGPTIDASLPLRLAHLLAGSPDGPGAQHFVDTDIDSSATYADGFVFSPDPWEVFFFNDSSRPSAELPTPLFYSGFSQSAPLGTNGAIPYFLMRSDTGKSATWAAATLGAQSYDDHQHKNFGHIEIVHGSDPLLVDASQWMGDAGGSGIIGGDTEEDNAAAANTLFFDDYGDFMYSGENQYYGGQGDWGIDQVTAEEQNDVDTFARSDLSSAYNAGSDQTMQSGRRLEHFYRSFLYLRLADIFVVFDQVGVKASTDVRGPYRKHLRWHFPNVAAVSGNRVTVSQGSSKLIVDTLLPLDATITPIDESHNPDDVDADSSSTDLDSGTWRVEVSGPADSLTESFLTVFEPGDSSRPPISASSVTSLDGKMTGALIVQPSGRIDLVLFNAGSGQIPAPIAETSSLFSLASPTVWTLCGVTPDQKFSVVQSGSVVTVSQSAGGTVTSSAAGILTFAIPAPVGRQAEGIGPGAIGLIQHGRRP